jgi:hypothetical protein
MQAPVAYHRDCMKYLGRILDHDGGFGKTPDEAIILSEVFEKTAERWESVFGEPYVATRESGTKCWHDCKDRCWHACSEIAVEVSTETAGE